MDFRSILRDNKYFYFEEFVFSKTAKEKKIDNTPSFEVIANIVDFLPLLNELRDKWGSAITITSGYRSKKLNSLVGGSSTSAHMIGYAVDLQPKNGDIDGFIRFCKDFFKNRKDFDQVIIEKNGSVRWVHIGYKNNNGLQRMQLFNIDK